MSFELLVVFVFPVLSKNVVSHEKLNHRVEHRHCPISLLFRPASQTSGFAVLIVLEATWTNFPEGYQ